MGYTCDHPSVVVSATSGEVRLRIIKDFFVDKNLPKFKNDDKEGVKESDIVEGYIEQSDGGSGYRRGSVLHQLNKVKGCLQKLVKWMKTPHPTKTLAQTKAAIKTLSSEEELAAM